MKPIAAYLGWSPDPASPAHLKHALHGFEGLQAQRFIHINGRRQGLEADLQFLQGVEPHVGACVAAAAIEPWDVEQGFLWNPSLHLMQDPRFRQNDEAVA